MSHVHDEDVGAWVLGALDEAEAHAFSAHLETCERCRAEVSKLQFVVDTLPLASPIELPPVALRSRIMQTVEAEAELLRAAGPAADRPRARATAGESRLRRWFGAVRPLPAAALACGLLVAGLAAGANISGRDEPAPSERTIATETRAPNAVGQIIVTGEKARLVVSRMPAPSQGRVYQVWFKREGKAPEPTHTLFNVRRDGQATVAIDEPIGEADELLVTAEPDGGSIIPTRQPVLRATL